MVRFGSERVQGMFEMMGDAPIENGMVTKSITSAQKRVEGLNFDMRKTLLDYDDVLRQQRETIYDQRNYILENEDIHSVVYEMFKRVVENVVDLRVSKDGKKEVINYEEIVNVFKRMGLKEGMEVKDIEGLGYDDTKEKCLNIVWGYYEDKIKDYKEQVLPIEKTMVLRVIDRAWVFHIDTMAKLRDGIGLRSYAQNNPLQAYVEEGFELFEDMMKNISTEVVVFCLNVKVVVRGKKA